MEVTEPLLKQLAEGGDGLYCVDMREPESFAARRLQGSSSLPWSQWRDRTSELPPPGRSLVVVLPDGAEESEGARKEMARDWLAVYRIVAVTPAGPALWDAAARAGCPPATGGDAVVSRRMWEPGAAVRRGAELMEAGGVRPGAALDLGAGSCRDAVFLAERGWTVTAVDNRRSILERGSRLARVHGTSERLRTCLAELEREGGWADLGRESWGLVVMSRYLYRPLLLHVRDHLVSPGGFAVIQHFLVGASHPTDPDRLLRPRELPETFASYRVLLYEESQLDDGRPVALLVAQRPDS